MNAIGTLMTTFYLLITPIDAHPEYATYVVKAVVAHDADPYWMLLGEGRNLHGDYAPMMGSAMRDGEGYRVSLHSTLDTSHEDPYRGYYIMSVTLHLTANLGGAAFVGNVDVDHAPIHNDYSVGIVRQITEGEYLAFGGEMK